MHGKDQAQFAQFFEEVEEIVHTPSRTTSRAVPSSTPKTRQSTSNMDSVIMTPRMEIMLRKEQKAREEEANLTFRPHVNKHGHGTSPSSAKISGKDSANRFDALYSDALKRHLEAQWKESADQKELTFSPKITERGRSRASSRNASRTGSRASSPGPATDSAIDRLHSTQKGKLKHGVDPDNKLTFKPEITKRAMSIDRKETAKRLYAPNSIDKEKAKAAQREMEIRERELEKCTFSPQLVSSSAKYVPKEKVDIRERMSRFEEMKKAKLQERQKQQLEQELADATFKPALESKAKRAPTPTKPFHERLAQPFERHVPTELAAELNASMTFKPTLITKRATSPNGRASEYQSVHERLFKEGEQRKKETQLAMEALKQEAETNFTFSPEINHNSKVVSADAGPVFERLATSTSKQYMQEVLMKVKTELELKDCTFHPKLSTEHHKYIPKEGTENTPVHERLNQEAELKRQEKDRLEQLRLENALKHHTFAPQIPESSKSMAGMRGSFVGSPEGGAPSGGSVAGDDIFSRLNAQSTLAKTPRSADQSNPSPTKTRSIIISEEERAKLYERLSAPPKTLSFVGSGKTPGGDDTSSVNNRKSIAQIDDVINRLHTSHTKAKLAPAFEDPQPLHAMLRTNSMSNSNTPNGSPDKSLSRRNSMSTIDAPVDGSPAPKRMMSMSLTMSPPPSLQRKGSVSGMSPGAAASPSSALQRKGSVGGMVPPSPAAAAPAAASPNTALPRTGSVKTMPSAGTSSSASRGSVSGASAADAPPAAPKVVPRNVAPQAAPAAAMPPAPPAARAAPAPQAASSKPSSGGDDFLSKIEASMNMLTMNPAQIVAQQQGVPAPAPIMAPSPVVPPVAEPAPVAAPEEEDEAGGEYVGGADEEEDEEEEEEVANVEDEY